MNARNFDMNAVGGKIKITRSTPRRFSDDQGRNKKGARDTRPNNDNKRQFVNR